MEKLADISAFERLQGDTSTDSSMSVFNRECIGRTGLSGKYPYLKFDVDDSVLDAIVKYVQPQIKFFGRKESDPSVLRSASDALGKAMVKGFVDETNMKSHNRYYCLYDGIWRTFKSFYPDLARKAGHSIQQGIFDWVCEVEKKYRYELFNKQNAAQRQRQGQVQNQ